MGSAITVSALMSQPRGAATMFPTAEGVLAIHNDVPSKKAQDKAFWNFRAGNVHKTGPGKTPC